MTNVLVCHKELETGQGRESFRQLPPQPLLVHPGEDVRGYRLWMMEEEEDIVSVTTTVEHLLRPLYLRASTDFSLLLS